MTTLAVKHSLLKMTLSLENVPWGCSKSIFFLYLEEGGTGKKTGDIYP